MKATQQLEDTIQTETACDTANHSTEGSVWQRIVEIGAQVPEEEWAKVQVTYQKNRALLIRQIKE